MIRLVSVSDQMQLPDFHDLFRTILGWRGDLGYLLRVHGREFNSFRRKTQSKALHELKLHRQEKFLYICDTLHLWEWDVRVVDMEAGVTGNHLPSCVGNRGAAPPECCGGPTGYRLVLRWQRLGAAVSPGNILRPVTISNSTTPKDQISARLSTSPPRACSGFI
jgi:hypothetical protein